MKDTSMIIGALWAGLTAITASPLAQTIAGGLIGAYAAGRAVDRQISADRSAEKESDDAAIARLKLGLRVEMEAVMKMTEQSVGPAITEWRASGGSGMFASVFPVQSDYFTLFGKNADQLGLVDEQTATIVIQAYIDLKGAVDSFLYNNRLLEELEQARLKMGNAIQGTWVKEHMDSVNKQLQVYGPLLIANYDQALVSVSSACKHLKLTPRV